MAAGEATHPSLDARLDRIEAALLRLEARTAPLDAVVALGVPAAVSFADTFDQHAGPDTDARLRSLVRLLELTSRPGVAERLDRALELADAAPGLVATAIDSLDALARAPGLDPDARLRALVRLADVATRPGVAEAAEVAADWAGQAPGVAAMAVDALDAAAARMAASTWGPEERMHAVLGVLERASRPDTARRLVHALDGLVILDELLDSGVLDRTAVSVVGQVGIALRETASAPVEPAGLWGALQALRGVDLRRALGFVLQLARNFGARLAP